MKCTEARLALLEADPATLEGRTQEPLARHILSCADCRARAEAILQGECLLASGLSEEMPLPDPDRIIAMAQGGDPVVIPFTKRFRRGAWGGAGAALIPLAAAATLAALFLGRTPSLPGPEFIPRPVQAGLEVEAPAGRSVAVLETSNPDITVLWLF